MNIFEKRKIAMMKVQEKCPYCGKKLQNVDQNREDDYLVLIHEEPSYAASPDESVDYLSGGCMSCVLHRIPRNDGLSFGVQDKNKYGIAELFTFSAYGYNNEEDKSAPVVFYSMSAAQHYIMQEKGKVYAKFMTTVDKTVLSICL